MLTPKSRLCLHDRLSVAVLSPDAINSQEPRHSHHLRLKAQKDTVSFVMTVLIVRLFMGEFTSRILAMSLYKNDEIAG